MAVELRSYSVAAVTASTITIDTPAGVQDGDLLIAHLGSYLLDATRPWTLLAGWTQIYEGGGGNSGRYLVCWKIAASEGASYSFVRSTTSTRSKAAIITAWTGAHATTPINQSAYGETDDVCPSVETTVANCVVLSMLGSGTQKITYTEPNGVTFVVNRDSGGGTYTSVTLAQGYFTQAAAGATGEKTWTDNGGIDDCVNHTIAIAPVASASVDLPFKLMQGSGFGFQRGVPGLRGVR